MSRCLPALVASGSGRGLSLLRAWAAHPGASRTQPSGSLFSLPHPCPQGEAVGLLQNEGALPPLPQPAVRCLLLGPQVHPCCRPSRPPSPGWELGDAESPLGEGVRPPCWCFAPGPAGEASPSRGRPGWWHRPHPETRNRFGDTGDVPESTQAAREALELETTPVGPGPRALPTTPDGPPFLLSPLDPLPGYKSQLLSAVISTAHPTALRSGHVAGSAHTWRPQFSFHPPFCALSPHPTP